jgi:uncharacterized protein (TIGR04255 family)
MPFPSTPRVIYRNNPLAEVICQLRFPPILQISSEEPAQFQGLIRADYPLYEVEGLDAGLPKEFSELLGGIPFPKIADAGSTHKFLAEDRSRLISLTREFVAATDTKYRRWEVFREEIARAKRAVESTYKPAFYTRLGLRYRNVLDKDALGLGDHDWWTLINPAFLGVLGAEEVRMHVQEISAKALLRSPDVKGGLVNVRHGLTRGEKDGRQQYMVDADFFTENREGTADVFKALDTFNGLVGNLFRWSISGVLRSALGPMELGPPARAE